MKLTLMRDNGETTTMRTLDINIQIESPASQQPTHEHPLRITGQQTGRRQEIGQSCPGCHFSQNSQRYTDDRI